MSEPYPAPADPDEPGRYAIRLQGHLEDRWAARFEGLTLTREDNGDTLLLIAAQESDNDCCAQPSHHTEKQSYRQRSAIGLTRPEIASDYEQGASKINQT